MTYQTLSTHQTWKRLKHNEPSKQPLTNNAEIYLRKKLLPSHIGETMGTSKGT